MKILFSVLITIGILTLPLILGFFVFIISNIKRITEEGFGYVFYTAFCKMEAYLFGIGIIAFFIIFYYITLCVYGFLK